MLRAGLLRETIAIQRAIVTRDAHGAAVLAWTTVSSARAMMKPSGGGEKGEQDTMRSRPGYEATLRAGVTLRVSDRILWRDRVFDVVSAEIDPSRETQIALLVETPDPTQDTSNEPELGLEFPV